MKVNKSVLSIFLAIVVMFFSTLAANASDYSKVTDSAKIKAALNLLEKTESTETLSKIMGNNPSKKEIKIMFFDLSTISTNYSKAHALATVDNNGTQYILISDRHQNASAEAISCLLAHEATHQLTNTTLNEEVQAWTNEAQQWAKVKAMNPTLGISNDELTQRLNTLEQLYARQLIAYEVKTNPYYTNLK